MKFDIVVIGGGLAGASLLAALKGSGLRLALIESRPPAPLPDDDSWDARVYAISPGSVEFLQSSGIWQRMNAARITSVHEMRVHGDDNAARIDFSAYESGVPELACIIENRQLQHAVWEELAGAENVQIFCPAQCDSLAWQDSHVELTLADGTVLQTALLIGADGINSRVREQAGIGVDRHSYYQTGVVANFETERVSFDPCPFHDFENLRFRDIFRIHAANSLALRVDLHHEVVRLIGSHREKRHKHEDDEFKWREVVVIHHDLIFLRSLNLLLGILAFQEVQIVLGHRNLPFRYWYRRHAGKARIRFATLDGCGLPE